MKSPAKLLDKTRALLYSALNDMDRHDKKACQMNVALAIGTVMAVQDLLEDLIESKPEPSPPRVHNGKPVDFDDDETTLESSTVHDKPLHYREIYDKESGVWRVIETESGEWMRRFYNEQEAKDYAAKLNGSN